MKKKSLISIVSKNCELYLFINELCRLVRSNIRFEKNIFTNVIQILTIIAIFITAICSKQMITESKIYRFESLRPWVGVENFEIHPILDATSIRLEYIYNIKNYGKSPAKNVTIKSYLTYDKQHYKNENGKENQIFSTVFQGESYSIQGSKFFLLAPNELYKGANRDMRILGQVTGAMFTDEIVYKRKRYFIIKISYEGPSDSTYYSSQILYLKAEFDGINSVIVDSKIE